MPLTQRVDYLLVLYGTRELEAYMRLMSILAESAIEATPAIVLSSGKLGEQRTWDGCLVMPGTFAAVVLIVTTLAVFCPKNLLYGKQEHANPVLAPSALRDQIEDLTAANVKAECLKS